MTCSYCIIKHFWHCQTGVRVYQPNKDLASCPDLSKYFYCIVQQEQFAWPELQQHLWRGPGQTVRGHVSDADRRQHHEVTFGCILYFDSAANGCHNLYNSYLCHWCYHTICTAGNSTATAPWRSTTRRRAVCTTWRMWVCRSLYRKLDRYDIQFGLLWFTANN